MKKTFVVFLTLLILSQLALAHGSGITEVYQEFAYTVNVEWDQKDPAVLEAAEEKLAADISELTRAGLKPREMLHELLAQVPNAQYRAEILAALTEESLVTHTPEEVAQLCQVIAERTQATGAAWSTLATVAVGGVLALVVARVALEIYFHEWGKRL